MASTTFGMARSTLDVDIAADVRLEHVDAIVAALRVVDVFVPPDTRYARMATCANGLPPSA